MKDIKFRIIKESAIIIAYEQLSNNGWVHWLLNFPDIPEAGCFDDNFWGYKSSCIRNQYTGLKDKNGKEIYEGDIVNAIANSDYPQSDTVSDIIFSHDLQWCIRTRLNDGIEYSHGLPILWGAWENIEVIGNIYENPELVKQTVLSNSE